MMRKEKAELLAPCGDYDCVIAAINHKADAIYLGGQLFNARAYAANFDIETLEKVCDLCHTFFMKVYVTVNTLYKDSEYTQLAAFIDDLYAIGVDGLIMQDIGAIHYVRKIWPDLHVHASTQLTANSLRDVKMLEELGVSTVVLSRELNLDEIKEIKENTSMRVETFIHGALCVSYSGQCLMSSVAGNRSGNRGKCAQNCRLPYTLYRNDEKIASGHLLSTKDICTVASLPELLNCGVDSLKIEGRMKSPEYVAGVTSIYRKYLDLYYSGEPYTVDEEDLRELRQLFNRGFFSEGYLKTHSGMDMMCPVHVRSWGNKAGTVLDYDRRSESVKIRSDIDMIAGDGIEIWTDDEEGCGCYLNKDIHKGETVTLRIKGRIRKGQKVFRTFDKKLNDRLRRLNQKITRRTSINGSIILRKGEKAVLTFSCNGYSVTAYGAVCASAVNQPLTDETVKEQISKLGNTPFLLEDLQIEMGDGIYLNRSELNQLKNDAAELLQKVLVSSYKRERKHPVFSLKERHSSHTKTISAYVSSMEQFACALRYPEVRTIYFPLSSLLEEHLDEITEKAHQAEKQLIVALPRIWRSYIYEKEEAFLNQLGSSDIDGWLINCLGHYDSVKQYHKLLYLDYTSNIINSQSLSFWEELNINRTAVSIETSKEEINSLSAENELELLAYGRLPLMVTHQCPIGNYDGNKTNHIYCTRRYHTDTYTLSGDKNSYLLHTDCDNCICSIESEKPIDVLSEVDIYNVDVIRLSFSDESAAEVEKILKRATAQLKGQKQKKVTGYNPYEVSIL